MTWTRTATRSVNALTLTPRCKLQQQAWTRQRLSWISIKCLSAVCFCGDNIGLHAGRMGNGNEELEAVAAQWRSVFCIKSHVPHIKQTHFMFYLLLLFSFRFSMKMKFKNRKLLARQNKNRQQGTQFKWEWEPGGKREREIL